MPQKIDLACEYSITWVDAILAASPLSKSISNPSWPGLLSPKLTDFLAASGWSLSPEVLGVSREVEEEERFRDRDEEGNPEEAIADFVTSKISRCLLVSSYMLHPSPAIFYT